MDGAGKYRHHDIFFFPQFSFPSLSYARSLVMYIYLMMD